MATIPARLALQRRGGGLELNAGENDLICASFHMSSLHDYNQSHKLWWCVAFKVTEFGALNKFLIPFNLSPLYSENLAPIQKW